MRRILLMLLAVLVASPVLAEEKKEDRWKFSVSGPVVGPGVVSANPENFCYRCQDGFTANRYQFVDEYVERNNAVPNSVEWDISYYASHKGWLAPTADLYFRTHPGGFFGHAGDEYLLLAKSRSDDYRESGVAVGTSLEYRAVAGLWLAFSFSVSRDMIESRREDGQFMRVDSIEKGAIVGPSNSRHWDPTIWHMQVSRYRVARVSEYRERFFSYTFLAKYDLTRGNDHWSVLPQVGMEALLERRAVRISEQYEPFSTFAIDESAKSITWQDSKESSWRERYRPVVGLSLELYPGGKDNVVSVFVDGRYRFNADTRYNTFPGGRQSQLVGYGYRSYPTDVSVIVGGLVRF